MKPRKQDRFRRQPAHAFTLLRQRERVSALRRAVVPRLRDEGGVTLIELLVIVGIIALLMVLMAPALTYIKGGTDVTSAAYSIKGVLDIARTYAQANNTYTWVGFYEENVANPASPNSDTPAVGRLLMSIVASKDGTNVATTNPIVPTTLVQLGKLTKIENVHIVIRADDPDFPEGTNQPPGTTFDTRPTVASTYCLGDTTSSKPFQYPLGGSQYTFTKTVQFSPDGEARLSNSADSPQPVTAAEIGLRQTHGPGVDMNSPNVVAIQFTGIGGAVRIYRK